MSDPWRYACPKGHRDVRFNNGGVNSDPSTPPAYCRTCGTGLDHAEITDLKRA